MVDETISVALVMIQVWIYSSSNGILEKQHTYYEKFCVDIYNTKQEKILNFYKEMST